MNFRQDNYHDRFLLLLQAQLRAASLHGQQPPRGKDLYAAPSLAALCGDALTAGNCDGGEASNTAQSAAHGSGDGDHSGCSGASSSRSSFEFEATPSSSAR